MADIEAATTGLQRGEDGVWRSASEGQVSYPSDGNESSYILEEDSFWFRHRNEVIRCLADRFAPGKTIYDVGGGNGCVTRHLADGGVDAVLLEPGPDGIRNAQRRGVAQIIQATFQEAGFVSESVPAAGMFDVLEHVEKDRQFLEALADKMEKKGVLFLTVPAFRLLWSFEDDYAGHYRRYSSRQLRRVVEEAGFEVIYHSYLFSFLVIPILIMRSLPTLLGRRKEVTTETSKREHDSGSGVGRQIVESLLDWEMNRIYEGNRIPFGSSCLLVARVPQDLAS